MPRFLNRGLSYLFLHNNMTYVEIHTDDILTFEQPIQRVQTIRFGKCVA